MAQTHEEYKRSNQEQLDTLFFLGAVVALLAGVEFSPEE